MFDGFAHTGRWGVSTGTVARADSLVERDIPLQPTGIVRRVILRLVQLLAFDPISWKYFVMITSPNNCVHSDTILPTTCPAFPSGSNTQ